METKLRLAGVIRNSITDGPGYRFVVFVQGCPHKCKGCHNPETHDFKGGYETSVENLMTEIKKDKILQGITLSGGEPFTQANSLVELCKQARKNHLDIVSFSGYTFEELLEGSTDQNGWENLLSQLDYLIDGKYEENLRSLELKFRGSKNQRIIDVKKSLKCKEAILAEKQERR